MSDLDALYASVEQCNTGVLPLIVIGDLGLISVYLGGLGGRCRAVITQPTKWRSRL
jgi:hypothetical protein